MDYRQNAIKSFKEEKMESKKINSYCWNFNKDEEDWYNSEISIKNCIKEARFEADEDKEVVYIGEVENHVPTVDIERIVDDLIDQAYDECGECSEGWLDGAETKELEEKLNEVLQEWLKKTNQEPTFGQLVNMHCYDLKTGKKIENSVRKESE